MSSDERPGVVVYLNSSESSEIDAIDAYSRRLVTALKGLGRPTTYQDAGLSAVLASVSNSPRWMLLQYNPFSYGTWGFAPALVRDAIMVKRRWPRSRLVISVHEAWVPIGDWRSALMGGYQRAQLRSLLRLANGVVVAREKLQQELRCSCTHIPVGSNVVPVPVTVDDARHRLDLAGRLVITLFGRRHPSRALSHAEAAIAALASEHGPDRLCILNLGSDCPILAAPAGIEVRSPGLLTDEDLSLHLRASDVLLLPFTDGLSTRRGTLMAGLAHGVPVVGLSGSNTDRVLIENSGAMMMMPNGALDDFACAVVRLTRDPSRMRDIGVAGRELYERTFDWPVIAREVLAVVERSSRTAP
jgi:glycosyltransferase involved in cell wall biosynthesis